ncbi:MAG TPA: helix-turn-helix domain-containing protein [Blastocatellia bacterium]
MNSFASKILLIGNNESERDAIGRMLEHENMVYFLQHPGHCVTRDMILNSVWGYESYPNTRTVDMHVVRLRQKLEPDQKVARHFGTVHGVGYRFVPYDENLPPSSKAAARL